MDSLQPYRASPSVVPPEIYKSLLDIAKQGYDASDVTNWYLVVKRDLDQLSAANADTSYSLTPPFSVCSPVPVEHETQPPNTPLDSTARSQSIYGTPTNNPPTTGGQSIYKTPTTNGSLWSETFISEPFQQSQINATTSRCNEPAQICTTSAAEQSGFLPIPSPWSATESAFPIIPTTPYPTTAYSTTLFGYDQQAQYYNPDPYTQINPESRKRRASQPNPYDMPMGSTPIAFGPPIEPAMQPDNSQFPQSTLSNELTYLAPISIIPSRKRRKTLPKGMKKFIQAVQLPRQN